MCQLWEVLSQNFDFEFLLTRRLNQDALENLFSVLRQKGGCSDNPTPTMFGRLFRQVFTEQLMTVSQGANCEADNDTVLMSVGDAGPNSNSEHAVPASSVPASLDVDEAMPIDPDIVASWCDNVTVPEENGCCYVFGYMLRKLQSLHGQCEQCTASFVSKSESVQNTREEYISHRAYPTASTTSTFGKLLVSTDTYYNYLMSCEAVLYDYFGVHAHEAKLITNMIKALKCVPLQGKCNNYPMDSMLQFFCRVRINYLLKFSNRGFAKCSKKNRKLFKLQSL
jgi:hypothetical protein